jgi:hypothetical protein
MITVATWCPLLFPRIDYRTWYSLITRKKVQHSLSSDAEKLMTHRAEAPQISTQTAQAFTAEIYINLKRLVIKKHELALYNPKKSDVMDRCGQTKAGRGMSRARVLINNLQ